MKRASFLPLLLLLAGPVEATQLEEQWRNWSHLRPIDLERTTGNLDLAAIPIDDAVYEHALPNLDDLRIVNAAGEEVGYAIWIAVPDSRQEWRTAGLLDAGFVVGQYTQVVADLGTSNLLHDRLELDLGSDVRDWLGWVEVAASPDRATWRVVKDRAPIFRFSDQSFDLRQTALGVRYSATRDRWLRIRILTGDREIPIRSAKVCEDRNRPEKLTSVRTTLRKAADRTDQRSQWTTPETASLGPMTAVSFTTDRREFHRPVEISVSDDGETWRQIGRGLVYRIEPASAPRANQGADMVEDAVATEEATRTATESLRVRFPSTSARYWRISVDDRDDSPIPDLEPTLERPVVTVVFPADPETNYRMLYGNHLASRPAYEISQIKTPAELEDASLGSLGTVTANQQYVSGDPFTERHPVVLWLALLSVVAVLGFLAIKTLR